MNKKSKIVTYEKLSSVYTVFYKYSGYLPYEKNVDDSHYWRDVLIHYSIVFTCHVGFGILVSMYLGHSIRIMLQGQFVGIDCLCESLIIYNTYIRFLMLNMKRRKFKFLMDYCGTLWSYLKHDEYENIVPFERKAYYIQSYFMWSTAITATFYVITAQIIKIPPAETNGTVTRMLPLKFYVDVQNEPWYSLVTLLHIIVSAIFAVTISGAESVGPFFVMMTCGYLRTIQKRFLAISEEKSNDSKLHNINKTERLPIEDILDCVKFHQQIMEFYEEIERFLRGVFLIQISCTVYNTSLIGIKLLQNEKEQLRYCGVLILNLLQFFTCQWIPEHLLIEGETLAMVAYDTTLRHKYFERKANMMLLFIMLRSEKPLQLTAGGYINLSLESFQRMIMSAFSIFTLLKNFSK